MPLDTQHPQYKKFIRPWRRVEHALEDEETLQDITIRGGQGSSGGTGGNVVSSSASGDDYIPMTAGMRKLDNGAEVYRAYVKRARFPAVTMQAKTGIVGLVFEKDPNGADTDTVVTNTGQNNIALARDVVADVVTKGMNVLVVDAPETGGVPYITSYDADCRINWRSRNEEEPTLTVLKESRPAPDNDKYDHDTETIYREYERLENGTIQLTRYVEAESGIEILGEPIILPIRTWPIITPGSLDLKPRIDPIPLLPVARAAIAAFRKSALHEFALYMSAHPQPWVKGMDEPTFKGILEVGTGSGSVWDLGEGEFAECGYLEVTGKSLDKLAEAVADEIKAAESHAVRLTQTQRGVEAAESLAMRQSTQHASIYTIAQSVGLAITRAQEIRAEWGGLRQPKPFKLQTDFTPQYAAQELIRVINDAVNAGNYPQQILWELARRLDLTELNDEDMADLLDRQGLNTSTDSGLDNDPANEDETAGAVA